MEKVTKIMLAAAAIIFISGTVWGISSTVKQSQNKSTSEENSRERGESRDRIDSSPKTIVPEPVQPSLMKNPVSTNKMETDKRIVIEKHVIIKEITTFERGYTNVAGSFASSGDGWAYAQAYSW